MELQFIDKKKSNSFRLKDCPCCGGEAVILRENFGKTVWVQCTECGLSTSKYDLEPAVDQKNGLEWAVYRWNMRCRHAR